jgi:hypothetical protein
MPYKGGVRFRGWRGEGATSDTRVFRQLGALCGLSPRARCVRTCSGSVTTQGLIGPRQCGPARWCLPLRPTTSAPWTRFSRLNTRPVRTPVNASPISLQLQAHDSGSMWVAIPSSYGTFIRNTLPVSTGALATWRRFRCCGLRQRPLLLRSFALCLDVPLSPASSPSPCAVSKTRILGSAGFVERVLAEHAAAARPPVDLGVSSNGALSGGNAAVGPARLGALRSRIRRDRACPRRVAPLNLRECGA